MPWWEKLRWLALSSLSPVHPDCDSLAFGHSANQCEAGSQETGGQGVSGK